jgi:hypothetical protein
MRQARPPFQSASRGPVEPASAPAALSAARWSAIVDDLVARGVAGTPTLVSADAMTFSDGSLGCPSPGRSYTQALVDGMRVVVSVDGVTHDYRFGADDIPHRCER